jgi:hypothetical protein
MTGSRLLLWMIISLQSTFEPAGRSPLVVGGLGETLGILVVDDNRRLNCSGSRRGKAT